MFANNNFHSHNNNRSNTHNNRPNINKNIFVSFLRSQPIRGYDSLNSNAEKDKITNHLEQLCNPNSNAHLELEEILITLKIPKLLATSQKKLYYLQSLNQDIFKFVNRFKSIQRTHEWTEKLSLSYLEYRMNSEIFDKLSHLENTETIIKHLF